MTVVMLAIVPRMFFLNLPIKRRLPLLIGTLLIAVLIASTWASYYGVRQSALEAGHERLLNLTQQLASLSQQGTTTFLAKTVELSGEPAIRSYLLTPEPTTRAAAIGVLRQFAAVPDSNSLQIELWDVKHSGALVMPDDATPEPADLTSEFNTCARQPFKLVGAIRVLNGAIVYPAIAAVRNENGTPIGFLVWWRRVAISASARQQLSDLLGRDVAFYYGNNQDDIFTDLDQLVPKPPANPAAPLEVLHYSRNGRSVVAMERPIVGTPWFIAVELPEQAILAKAKNFLRRIVLIGLTLLAIGLVASSFLSRSITRPLNSLTDAASKVSRGNTTATIQIKGGDELGALADAFNLMLRRLNEEHDHLEATTQQLWQFSKLATMGELAASIAHELNNPLATISLRTEALLTQVDNQGRNSVEVILQELERMAVLIKNLLEFSRRSHAQISTVNVGSEITNSVEFISYYLRKRSVEVIENFAETLPCIHADRQQLRQLFLNLLTNASDAMPKGGKLTITASPSELKKQPALEIIFADTGGGISSDELERIWEPFFTTKPEGTGTGLGLGICRRIVEDHHGEITIQSEVGRGTTVRIVLPANGSRAENS
jgi:signal transduction histidine kinase